MARDPADVRASPHGSMADADLGNPAELKPSHSHSHSLPNVTSDLKESNSVPHDLDAAADEEDEEDAGAAVGQHANGRRRNPLSVCSAPAHVLEALRPRAASEPAASGSPLRTVSESPRTDRPWIMRHMCASQRACCVAGLLIFSNALVYWLILRRDAAFDNLLYVNVTCCRVCLISAQLAA